MRRAAAHKEADPGAALAEEKAKTASIDQEAWFNNSVALPTAHRAGIGKYIAPKLLEALRVSCCRVGIVIFTCGSGTGGRVVLGARAAKEESERGRRLWRLLRVVT